MLGRAVAGEGGLTSYLVIDATNLPVPNCGLGVAIHASSAVNEEKAEGIDRAVFQKCDEKGGHALF